MLTSKGIREKSLLTHSFIGLKRQEFRDLKAETQTLEEEVGLGDELMIAARGKK